MAKWVYTFEGAPRHYPTLGGFIASTGDVIEAASAPDARWEAADPGATVTIPASPSGGVVEPSQDAILVYDRVLNRGVWRELPDTALDPAVAAIMVDADSAVRASLDARYVAHAVPLGGGADDAPHLNATLEALRASGGSSRLILSGDFVIGSCLRIGDDQTIDAYGASVSALASCGALIETAAMADMVLPRAMTATASSTGGTLASGTYAYRLVGVTAEGDTVAGLEATATVTGPSGRVTLSWADPVVGDPARITGWKVYGRTSGNVSILIGTTAANVHTITDTGAASTAGEPSLINATFGRTLGATILGGVWDARDDINPNAGNWVEGRYVGHGFDLQKVDGLTIRDVTVKNAYKWAIAVADFTNLTTSNLTFDTPSDGIHVLGPGTGWHGKGFFGRVGDDYIGMSLVEWPAYAVSEGSLRGMHVSDINSTDAPSAVRMLLGSGHVLDDVIVDGVSGDYTGFRDRTTGILTGLLSAAVVFCNQDQNNPGRVGGTVGALTLRSIRPRSHSTDVIQVDAVGSVLTIEGVHNATANVSAVRFGYDGTSGRPTTFDSVSITDMSVRDATGLGLNAVGTYTTAQMVNVVRPRLVATTGLTGRLIRLSKVTLGLLSVVSPLLKAASTSSRDVVYIENSAVVPEIVIAQGTLAYCDTLLYVNQTAGVSRATIVGGNLSNAQAAVKSKAPIAVRHRDITANTLSAGVVALYTATATPVSIEGDGALLTSAPGLSKDGSQVVTALSITTACDVSKLTKTANTAAYNTNAGLSCGVGPVICDGTNWKHLYSGATY